MKKLALAAALLAAFSMQPGWAKSRAHHSCRAASPTEAEQAIRYITDLMVASAACKNTVYSEFVLRNRSAVIHYQHAMIVHLHGTKAFDRWNTRLANAAAMRQSAVPPAQFCQQWAPRMREASTLDIKGFRAIVAAETAQARAQARNANCGK